MSSIWMLCPRTLVGKGNPAGDAQLRAYGMAKRVKTKSKVNVLRWSYSVELLLQMVDADGCP